MHSLREDIHGTKRMFHQKDVRSHSNDWLRHGTALYLDPSNKALHWHLVDRMYVVCATRHGVISPLVLLHCTLKLTLKMSDNLLSALVPTHFSSARRVYQPCSECTALGTFCSANIWSLVPFFKRDKLSPWQSWRFGEEASVCFNYPWAEKRRPHL